MISLNLLEKYNVPVPRYTSYPTVPYWNDSMEVKDWQTNFQVQFKENNPKNGISLYIHLPFCESLCTYCGCNKKITTNHSVEDEYIDAVLKEWDMYVALMNEKPIIKEIHLGGGTPTFFSPANLEKLLNPILNQSIIHENHEFSFEGHPNNTTEAHLKALYDLGFRRVSYGVQDNDPEVQRVINRIQPIENVQKATEMARAIGYHSVNFDLIYGLPLQNAERMERTIMQSIALKPDRVAFYSYAHVPWTSRGQRLFNEDDLPDAKEKMQLYQLGKRLFAENGYHDIGMDHFALPADDLYKASQEGWLFRNFMGYTTNRSDISIGLGVSAISDTGNAFAQNEKVLHNYYQKIHSNSLAVIKGYFLSAEDIAFRKYILDLSCLGKTMMQPEHMDLLQYYTFPELKKLEADMLIKRVGNEIRITETGRHFVRNICSAFDLHLLRKSKSAKTFSNAV
jgi:oxygen-independent coproporphyrinogen-3 oxidase